MKHPKIATELILTIDKTLAFYDFEGEEDKVIEFADIHLTREEVVDKILHATAKLLNGDFKSEEEIEESIDLAIAYTYYLVMSYYD